ncbi:MAG: hypothetical protein HYU64_16000 [Armatimonadetes bacterium]|nr:hypothetical protein [Armatimonadota bacterium]
MNIYLRLTQEFNDGRLRAILSGGQAVVLHRLALMSKDGDWILLEDDETMGHILSVLESFGATYRFGAPLDIRWMSGGWSAHFEFTYQGIRVRTDFITRPPRLTADRIERLWRDKAGQPAPFLDVSDLIETKKTNREKDYAVIGELARLFREYPQEVAEIKRQRPILASIPDGLHALEAALDAERRAMIHANEDRLSPYFAASEAWSRIWPDISGKIEGRPLSFAHAAVVDAALGILPFAVQGELT